MESKRDIRVAISRLIDKWFEDVEWELNNRESLEGVERQKSKAHVAAKQQCIDELMALYTEIE